MIPPLTDKGAAGWKQPHTSCITISDDKAFMSAATLMELSTYNVTAPSGVYVGKMWKVDSVVGNTRTLCWYDKEGDRIVIKHRQISILDNSPRPSYQIYQTVCSEAYSLLVLCAQSWFKTAIPQVKDLNSLYRVVIEALPDGERYSTAIAFPRTEEISGAYPVYIEVLDSVTAVDLDSYTKNLLPDQDMSRCPNFVEFDFNKALQGVMINKYGYNVLKRGIMKDTTRRITIASVRGVIVRIVEDLAMMYRGEGFLAMPLATMSLPYKRGAYWQVSS